MDAKKPAAQLFPDQVPTVPVPSVEVRDWRALIEFHHRLVRKRVRVKNGLRALCRAHGIGLPSGKRLGTKKGRHLLQGQALPMQRAALQRDLRLEQTSFSCSGRKDDRRVQSPACPRRL